MKRVLPYQAERLRPLLDADDDLWLDTARQLHHLLEKLLKSTARGEVRKLQRLAALLETIDRNAYTVSRAHLGGWALPGVYWYVARQLPKKLNDFVDPANSVGLPNDGMANDAQTLNRGVGGVARLEAYHFRTTVSHAVRVARVRRHTQQLLSNRRLGASLASGS